MAGGRGRGRGSSGDTVCGVWAYEGKWERFGVISSERLLPLRPPELPSLTGARMQSGEPTRNGETVSVRVSVPTWQAYHSSEGMRRHAIPCHAVVDENIRIEFGLTPRTGRGRGPLSPKLWYTRGCRSHRSRCICTT